MVCLQHTLVPSIYQAFLPSSSPPQLALRKSGSFRDRLSVMVRAEQVSSEPSSVSSQDALSRRIMLTVGASINLVYLSHAAVSFAAESKKGFLPVLDKKDGYTFYYPFGWQEVVIEGQDKVFKDVIEPLESVSVNLIPTNKQDIKDFGPPQEVAETLIKRVLAPSNQKTKLIEAKLQEVEGTTYYTFEFVSQARNYTRHALSTICIGNDQDYGLASLPHTRCVRFEWCTVFREDNVPKNASLLNKIRCYNVAGKFYTLTTGANERRWDKMKERLYTVVDSFRVFNV
ncbi:hypothetical protein V2J09_019437 [Rumex salicifolius]